MSAPTLLTVALAVLAAGMCVAFLGILAPGLFLTGTWIILAGLVGCAAAGLLALLPARTSTEG